MTINSRNTKEWELEENVVIPHPLVTLDGDLTRHDISIKGSKRDT